MKKIYYPNCSELIADFNMHDPKEFFEVITKLAKKYDWTFSPKLSLAYLELMTRKEIDDERLEARLTIEVKDKKGMITLIEYGSNGYDDSLGFRFDSGCNDYDSRQFEFFDTAIQECAAEIKAYDGGSTSSFEEWQNEKYK